MSIVYLTPMAMSQTKDELLKHLNMGLDTYALMAKEADVVYKGLTSDKRHLKKNCKRKPPYDWSDIVERSKDDAMRAIAANGTPHTNYYWNLAAETDDCPNWIARWFLYHKFRYRDGRNRNPVKENDGKHSHHSSSKHTHHKDNGDGQEYSSYYESSYYSGSTTYDRNQQGYDYTPGATSSTVTNSYALYDNTRTADAGAELYQYTGQEDGSGSGNLPYDPVRDTH